MVNILPDGYGCFVRVLFQFSLVLFLICAGGSQAAGVLMTDEDPLYLPAVGDHQLRLLSPTVLELTLITTKQPDPAPIKEWDFVKQEGVATLPATNQFTVTVGNATIGVQAVGFKRRVTYAPLRQRDMRIGNFLYLQLAAPVETETTVEVKNPDGTLWPRSMAFTVTAAAARYSPAIHVNQVGYVPALPKKAMVGYYLGSLQELNVSATNDFQLVEAQTGKTVFQGRLRPRPETGYTYTPTPYQKVLEADFTPFQTPGEYKLFVPGLGTSYPFFIDDGAAAAFTRTYALGIYHQRCGTDNALPFTRFVHDACHVAPAKVPTMDSEFDFVNHALADETSNYKANPRHTAPQLKNVAAGLYPFVTAGPVNVSGGHHDAGDYSKYTIDSALFIHYLVFAADVFPGVGALDNLGLPESGDGKSDVLQEAKWEADFLARMQDADGGFYFLVYPLHRPYENDVLPDKGDPQVVFPKTTAVTAAAIAALAETASSPLFKQQFPEAAALYLEKAKKGWAFLQRAMDKHGRDGSYQKITHYGDSFLHDDELAWAATELFLATGDEAYHKKLKELLNPNDPETRQWGWWRLVAAYGCAIRSYAFAVSTGRLTTNQIDVHYLNQCKAELRAAGLDQLRYARESAYGTSFPTPSKNFRVARWYFSGEQTFDMGTALQVDFPIFNDPRPQMLEAIISNMNYEGGCNPVNMPYVTGLGWRREREIVHHYAMNDRRVLPPSGIPQGNIQEGFYWMDQYKTELGAMSFPPDGAATAPYPFYDRWGDSFNVGTEFVVATSARILVTYALLMAQTPLKNQPWKSAPGEIAKLATDAGTGKISVSLKSPDLDPAKARIVWEARDQEPAYGQTFSFVPKNAGEQWVEFEAQWPDGRRVFGATNFSSTVGSRKN
ncbi:MAG: putative cellulase precursor protein [Pedosphaera sp.]|nr:putative cellulase precursor protein [Pedosphaera sp.]